MRIALGVLCCFITMVVEGAQPWDTCLEYLVYTQSICKLCAIPLLPQPPFVKKALPLQIKSYSVEGRNYISEVESILQEKTKIKGEECAYIDLVYSDSPILPSKRCPYAYTSFAFDSPCERKRRTNKQREYMRKLKKRLPKKAKNKLTLFVGLNNEDVVGIVTHQPTAEPCAQPSFYPGRTAVTHSIGLLAVREHYTNYGIGERLFQHAATYARQQGATHLVIAASTDNEPATVAYEKFTGSPAVATESYSGSSGDFSIAYYRKALLLKP